MSFTPTPEQLAIIEAAQSTSDNLIISALAGAAKTSTLVMIAEALPSTSILSLAFNKKIAMEMTSRLPANCTAMTLNSLGHRAWGQAIAPRLRLETSKTFQIVKEIIDGLKPKEKDEAYADLPFIIKTVDMGKANGFVPDGHYDRAKRLMGNDEFLASTDERMSSVIEEVVIEATIKSIALGWKGLIDFGDQLLLPTIFHGTFPQYPLVLIDEAQDLSLLNHAMLKKLAKKRLIAVGDERQAIYAFRGAHEESMGHLRRSFDMKPLTLSTSFRCPRKVVEEARWRAPHMQWPEWAAEGKVSRLNQWDASSIPEHAAIICRNNAPIFAMAIKLLKAGRYPQIIGNDVGKGLIKIMKKFGPDSLPKAELMERIAGWEKEKKEKSRSPGTITDRAECMRIFARQGETLRHAILYAEQIFNTTGPIQLMTGHKSKGLEYDNVFFLDPDLLGDEGQDRNLRYVIQTRAKQTLTYIRSDDFMEEEMEE